DAVQFVGVIDGGDERALHVLEPLEAVERVVRLHRPDLDVAPVLLEAPPRPHHGAGGADAGDEVGDAPFGLLPDLAPGGVVVAERVGLVRVLIGVEVTPRVLLDHLAAEANRAVGALHRVGEDQRGAERLGDLAPRPGDVAGHHQRHWVAERAPDERVGDAGVAARRVDDRLPGLERAGAEGVADHLVGGAVLDRAARVQELALGPQLDARCLALELVQPHDRRVADEVGHPLGHAQPRALDDVERLAHPTPSSCTTGAPPSSGSRRWRTRPSFIGDPGRVPDPPREGLRSAEPSSVHASPSMPVSRTSASAAASVPATTSAAPGAEGAAGCGGTSREASGDGARRGNESRSTRAGVARATTTGRPSRWAAPNIASSSKPTRTARSTCSSAASQAPPSAGAASRALTWPMPAARR